MEIRERFINKLAEMTENDDLIWKPVAGRYTRDDSYISDYGGASYELKMRPENDQHLIITCEEQTDRISGISALAKAVLYKEHTNWRIQEHIREVTEKNGIE